MSDQRGTREFKILRLDADRRSASDDHVVVEEPLEMIVEYGKVGDRQRFPLAVTMRTPGSDDALIRGFLLTEGIVEHPSQVTQTYRTASGPSDDQSITAALDPEVAFDPSLQQRHFYTTSSCGVCGKASIDMVRQVSPFRLQNAKPTVDRNVLVKMRAALRAHQSVFEKTGGIHAAGLFSTSGNLIAIEEDVGRHNAVDKLIGTAVQQSGLPLSDFIMLVSGRAGFELVQKAVVTGIAIFTAVGAPTSLAVELAQESGMTLVGFLKDSGMNVYAHSERILS